MTVRLSLKQLAWGFSTLGCPELSIREVIDLAARYQVPNIELRGMEDRLDTPAYLAEQFPDLAGLRSLLKQKAVRIVSLDSSFKLTTGTEPDRQELRDYCECAAQLNVPFVRIFGGGTMDTPLTDAAFQTAAEHYAWWLEEKARSEWTCNLILETHDGFCTSQRCLDLQEVLPVPLALLWDTHHTWKLGGEDLRMSWEKMGHLIRHVHVKDSVGVPSARHPYSYVQLGQGEFDLTTTLSLLETGGFDGVVCIEWERKWHPYMPPLADALARARELRWW